MSCVTSENEEGLMIVKIEYLYFSVPGGFIKDLMVFFSFLFALLTLCCFYYPSSLTFYNHFVVLITYYKVSIPVPAGELKVMRVDGTFQKDTKQVSYFGDLLTSSFVQVPVLLFSLYAPTPLLLSSSSSSSSPPPHRVDTNFHISSSTSR